MYPRRWVWLWAILLLAGMLRPAEAQRLVGVTVSTQTSTATNDAFAVDVGTAAGIGLQITGTWTGTITFQGTMDKSNWFTVPATDASTGAVQTSTTANGRWTINGQGMQQIRAFSTGLSSGTATLTFVGGITPAPQFLSGLTIASGTLNTTNAAVTGNVGNAGTVGIYITGTWAGTVVFESSRDGTNYVSHPVAGLTNATLVSTTTGQAGANAGDWRANVAGSQTFRVRASAVTGSQSLTATIVGAPSGGAVTVPGLTLSSVAVGVSTGIAGATTGYNVKASPGQVYAVYAYNPNVSACYLQLLNIVSATLGTTTPIASLGLAATASGSLPLPFGLDFTTAITIAGTTARAGGTGCTTAVDVSVFYK